VTAGKVSNRPKPARRVSPNLPDAQPRLLAFRIYEAAVRDLQQPAYFVEKLGELPSFDRV
jgi:hypothetical protein